MKVVIASIFASIALSASAFTAVSTKQPTIKLHAKTDDDLFIEVESTLLTRRESLAKSWLAGVMAAGIVSSSETASAFPNKISDKYDDRPKQRGSKPKNLGIEKRKNMYGEEYIGLKECGGKCN